MIEHSKQLRLVRVSRNLESEVTPTRRVAKHEEAVSIVSLLSQPLVDRVTESSPISSPSTEATVAMKLTLPVVFSEARGSAMPMASRTSCTFTSNVLPGLALLYLRISLTYSRRPPSLMSRTLNFESHLQMQSPPWRWQAKALQLSHLVSSAPLLDAFFWRPYLEKVT